MIAKLTGLVDSFGDDWAVIDVGGVGYLVYCSARSLRALPRTGEAASLLVETHVREDHIHLFGFQETAERDWFRLLQTVQGVGARVALGILSVLTAGELARTIAAQDKSPLTQASGVGGKLAARIVAELKDKIGNLALGPGAAAGETSPIAAALGDGGNAGDAVSALVNLGYRRVEAFTAIAAVSRSLGPEASIQTLITSGLRELGR